MEFVDRLLKPKQVAEALGVSVNRAYEIMKETDFPSIKLSDTLKGSIRVRPADLAQWIENKLSKKESA